MPTRLLELAPGDSHPKVKIMNTAQMKMGHVPYVTLSHCWGSTLIARLVRSLVEEYSLNIPWASLPQKLQAAIITVLKLELQYLWIDALCIIQDDNDDWTYEAARMAEVYSNSYLNIAADASRDSTGGLFRQRDPKPLRSFIVPQKEGVVDSRRFVFYTDKWELSVNRSPLARRAWTVQEKYLARRVLHFAEEEVHWECMELFTAECLPLLFNSVPENNSIVRKSLPHANLPPRQRTQAIYRIWYQLVSSYASGALTVTSDRPIAIAGLARIFCHLLELPESDYLCGMWRPRLQHDLMWQKRTDWGMHHEVLRLTNLPSWSWLSLCAGIWIYPSHEDEDIDTSNLITAEVVEASTSPCRDAFGSVSSGRVILRAPLCQVTIRKGDVPFYRNHKVNSRVVGVSGSLLREEEHFVLCLDDTTAIGVRRILDTTVYLMLGRASTSQSVDCLSDKALPRSEDQSWYNTSPRGSHSILKTTSTKLSLLEGWAYECLILKETA
ncbi:MAG: hypothetical protein M1820_008289 [Bogoriella megaspora]|nr:MAG: hypothetical protein M1820_008289 [Bogoriella megaspora]